MLLNAGDIFGDVRAHLNDVGNAQFTDEVQLPFINMAVDELQQELENHNIGLTNETALDIPLLANTTELAGLDLPEGLVEIENVWERFTGSGNDYQMMDRRNFLPPINANERTMYLQWYTFNDQAIEFVGSSVNEQLRIDYIKRRIPKIINKSTVIDIIGARSVLAYRTAGLIANDVGENKDRADIMNGNAVDRLNTLLSINLKGKQAITVRRRPFRAGYKFRGRVYR
jgi:hypothetical protein